MNIRINTYTLNLEQVQAKLAEGKTRILQALIA